MKMIEKYIFKKEIKNLMVFFSQKLTQENVFKFISSIFRKIYKGINITIFRYGQSGSSKIYIIFWGNWKNNLNIILEKKIIYNR